MSRANKAQKSTYSDPGAVTLRNLGFDYQDAF